jgi:hypothetical protein
MAHRTPIKKSPLKATGALAASAGLSALGYHIVVTNRLFEQDILAGLAENPMIVVLAMLFSVASLLALPAFVYMLVVAGIGGKGPCPMCGAAVETMFGRQLNLVCRHCGAYLESANDEIGLMDERCIAPEPTFAAPTPWKDILLVKRKSSVRYATDVAELTREALTKEESSRVLTASWPNQCCVCGLPAVRRETIICRAELRANSAVNIRHREADIIADGAPYCADHKEGVAFGIIQFANAAHEAGLGIKFRSLRYRNLFAAQNPWRWS